MKEKNPEIQDKQLEKDTTPKFRKFINLTCLILGIILLVIYTIGPMLVTTTQFARSSFDYYDTNTYAYEMFEDETSYVFAIKVEGVTHFDIYNKETTEITHDIDQSVIGGIYIEDTNVSTYLRHFGYLEVSDFFIQSAWSIAIISGIALILFSIANQHLAVRSRIAKNKGRQIARELNKPY